MDRLRGVAELLDGPLDDPGTLDSNLRDLARINRLTGGARLSVRGVAAIEAADGGGPPATLLDVGTGGADIPMTLLARARAAGTRLAITATDSRPEIIASAIRARDAVGRTPGLELAVADGRALPYPDGAFDVAHASLVIHHLERDDAIAFLGELRRVARRGIVVNDLVRGPHFWLGGWLLVHAIARSAYTRHDGPLSVRRAYSRAELRGLVDAAGLQPIATYSGFAGHRIAIAAR